MVSKEQLDAAVEALNLFLPFFKATSGNFQLEGNPSYPRGFLRLDPDNIPEHGVLIERLKIMGFSVREDSTKPMRGTQVVYQVEIPDDIDKDKFVLEIPGNVQKVMAILIYQERQRLKAEMTELSRRIPSDQDKFFNSGLRSIIVDLITPLNQLGSEVPDLRRLPASYSLSGSTKEYAENFEEWREIAKKIKEISEVIKIITNRVEAPREEVVSPKV
jgi:hypothetical protein